MADPERLGPIRTQVLIDNRWIDFNNHLNNAAWGLPLEKGRMDAVTKLGIPLDTPLRQIRIGYKQQIFKGNEITIVTFVRPEESGVEFFQDMLRGEEVVGTSRSKYGSSIVEMDAIQPPFSETYFELDRIFPSEGTELHHLTAVYYYEQARVWFLDEKEFDMAKVREEQGVRFMVGSLEATFAQAMHLEQRVLIRTAFNHYRSQFRFYQEILTDDGKVINRARIICALVDNEENLVRSSDIIDPIKAQLSSYLASI